MFKGVFDTQRTIPVCLGGGTSSSTRQVGLLILGTEAWVGVHQVEESGVGPEHKSPLCRRSPVCEGRRDEANIFMDLQLCKF